MKIPSRAIPVLATGLALLALSASSPRAAVTAADATAAFDQLKSLAGSWEGTSSDSRPFPLLLRVVSNGTALLEEMGLENQGQMVTVYHRDGASVMLTHYCAANNQPRMRLESVEEGGKRLVFRKVDVTNLASPASGHMQSLIVTFRDADHFRQEWGYLDSGKDLVHAADYTRAK